MIKWMTVANNASNVISEVKRTPLAAMTHLLISTKGALRRHPDPTYPFLALNQLNRPQKLASGHGQSPINYELR